MQTETNSETTPAPVDHLKPWLNAAYGRPGAVTSQYKNLEFTPEGEGRVAQIAGWLVGLTHGGKRELAEWAAADINRQFEMLNSYGGDLEASFDDGSPIGKVPRYVVQLGDDGTFGGFTLGWYRVTTEGSDEDGDRRSFLRNRWGDMHTVRRWGPQGEGPRDIRTFLYKFTFNGGLLYHGPGGGETFSVTLGDVHFWSIHT